MDAANITLVLVIVTALAFDFTNGFHDTANAMAASISTGALKPKVAVGLSAVLNLVGAFLSVQVALTVTNAVINLQTKDGAPNPELLADGGEAVLLIILPASRAASCGTCSPGCSACRPARRTRCSAGSPAPGPRAWAGPE